MGAIGRTIKRVHAEPVPEPAEAPEREAEREAEREREPVPA